MTGRAQTSRPRAGETFPEAVARWRLTLRTEVKHASSLPTSVFHARDLALEAMLAATTESMLARLQTPGSDASTGSVELAGQRLEAISADELSALPLRLRVTGERVPRLAEHACSEAIAVLVDAALGPDPAAAATAADLLRRRFDVGAADDAVADAAQLRQFLLAGLPAGAVGGPALDAVARAVVGVVAARTTASPLTA